MYLPDNLSNNVHMMKISPFRFATVEMTDEISLQSQRPGGYIQSNNKEQTFRSAKANPG